jgi:hypothetical protein
MQLPINEIFTPLLDFEKAEPAKAQYVGRAITLLLLLGGGYALHRKVPDAGSMKKGVREAGSSFMEYLVGWCCGRKALLVVGSGVRGWAEWMGPVRSRPCYAQPSMQGAVMPRITARVEGL